MNESLGIYKQAVAVSKRFGKGERSYKLSKALCSTCQFGAAASFESLSGRGRNAASPRARAQGSPVLWRTRPPGTFQSFLVQRSPAETARHESKTRPAFAVHSFQSRGSARIGKKGKNV